jgi:WD40 repeat protein
MPSQARSVAWNPNKVGEFAVGTFTSSIAVMDVDETDFKKMLSGCTTKVLSLRWHPLFDYILASGSADGIVRVWDIKNKGHKTLEGHIQAVRSLCWNYEIPWLLVSGGDDSKLALWDIRTNQLAYETKEPSVSVSCIDTHPDKPFLYATAHFDNSLLFWDIHGMSSVRNAMIKVLLNFSFLEYSCDPHDSMDPNINGRISGSKSLGLVQTLSKMKDFDRLKTALDLFLLQEGDRDIWNMIGVMHDQTPGDSNAQVLHITDSAFSMQSKAQNLL